MTWLLFFDSNDIVSRFSLASKVSDLEEQKEYYESNISEIIELHDKRENDLEYIEKFAREEYLMKKESEDVYVVVNEED